MRSVSVIGIGETKFGRFPDKSLRELIDEAGNKAIADSGINKSEIKALYMGNFNASYFCLQSHLGPLTSETLGLGSIPTLRVEGACASGSLAFRQGVAAIASGLYDIVLVGGVEKMTHRNTEEVTTGIAGAADVELEVNVGATFPSIFAMIANRYAHEYGDPRDAMTQCAIQNHANALLNPDAQLPKSLNADQVNNSLMIASPLTMYDCSLVTDGAAFVVLAATDLAEKLNPKRSIEVVGSGHAGDTITAASKESLTSFKATVNAAKEAYAMAGIGPDAINLAEVHDCFTITQIINCEDLGFFKHGQGCAGVLAGETARDGRIPINVSGGLKAKGHPIGATGLSQIYEVVTQLRQEAGERQLNQPRYGLTHNIGGTAATCTVHIFKAKEA